MATFLMDAEGNFVFSSPIFAGDLLLVAGWMKGVDLRCITVKQVSNELILVRPKDHIVSNCPDEVWRSRKQQVEKLEKQTTLFELLISASFVGKGSISNVEILLTDDTLKFRICDRQKKNLVTV